LNEVLALDDLKTWDAWRASIAELIATFCFVFIGVGAVVSSGIFLGSDGVVTTGQMIVIAVAHGFAIAIMVAATGRISGAHLNPAVTFSAVLTRKIGAAKGGMYVIAQLLGATLAALLVKAVIPDAMEGGLGTHALGTGISAGAGVAIEMVLTFILVFVIFATAVDSRGPSIIAPIAIGMAVLVDILVGLPLTGASMNPARTLGPALAAGQLADNWVFWVGPLGGGAIAALTYEYVFLRERGQKQ
jgi:MIP family channel proteins